MITHEQAKELYDAGFPCRFKLSTSITIDSIEKQYLPRLDEIIAEICKNKGERYFRLVRDDDGWRARNIQIEGQIVNWARTPEEAVKNLYIALNKK